MIQCIDYIAARRPIADLGPGLAERARGGPARPRPGAAGRSTTTGHNVSIHVNIDGSIKNQVRSIR